MKGAELDKWMTGSKLANLFHSLNLVRSGGYFIIINQKLIVHNSSIGIRYELAPSWMPQNT